jgi:hypothetical protein
MDTNNAGTHQACGNTNGGQSSSPWWLMILKSNIWANTEPITYSMPSDNITNIIPIVRVNYAAAYRYIGITKNEHGHTPVLCKSCGCYPPGSAQHHLYAHIDPTPFTIVVYPSAQPAITAGASAAAIDKTVRIDNEHIRKWRKYNNIHAALKKLLLNAMDPIYVQAIRDRQVSFNRCTPLEILAHLFTHYWQLTAPKMQANTNSMNQPWDPNTPFEMLIDQIEECSKMDAGNQPMSNQQIVNAAFTLIFNTGIFFDDCKAWNQKDPANQTWIQFKGHFLDAPHLLCQQQQTSAASGYHANTTIQEH